MPWYIYHALKQLFPSGRFFSFFSLMSIMGVMLGVCVLIIVQSVMNGFGEGIRQRIVETQGDIRIRSNEVVYDWEVQLERLQAEDMVVAAAPFAEGVVMLQHQNRPQFPMIRGVDPVAESDVIALENFITIGDLEDFDDEGVFLGEGLAYTLKAGPGSVVEVFTPLMLERLKKDEVLLPREFTVLGTFRTGSPQVDGNMVISTLRVMQELYGLNDGAHGISVKLRPGVDAWAYSDELEERVLRPGLEAISWLESNRDFLFVVQQEKRVISFIIIFIILVASFSIAIALMMAVMRKTREIGLLVAMGGRPIQVAYSFC
ncbi:MAG: ABC transporter permease, partial [Lentimonas sp.]